MMGFIVFRIKPERNALIIAQLAVPEDGPTCPTYFNGLTSTHVDSRRLTSHVSHVSDVSHISDVSVPHYPHMAQEHRRMGFGSLLLKTLIAEAKRLPEIHSIGLSSLPGSIKFYKRRASVFARELYIYN